jgi:hypothetical protein
MRQVFIPW